MAREALKRQALQPTGYADKNILPPLAGKQAFRSHLLRALMPDGASLYCSSQTVYIVGLAAD